MMDLAIIILAAGRSERFGAANKLLAMIDGEPVLARVLRAVLAADVAVPVVVTGYEAVGIRALATPLGVQTVHNPDAALGMGSSISAGVRASRDADGWLIIPGDLPFIQPGSVQTVAGAFDAHLPTAPTHKGARGHPVLFPSRFREDLEALSGDRGARHLLDECLCVAVDDPGILRDVDRPGDLSRHPRAGAIADGDPDR